MILVATVLSMAIRAAVEVRALVERASGRTRQDDPDAVAPLVDAAFDLAVRAAAVVAGGAAVLTRIGRPVALVALRPPILPSRFWPEPALALIVERGRNARVNADRVRAQVAGDLVVAVLDKVLDRIDLTQLVLDRVKLPNIIATLDIDDIAARLDLVPVVDRVPIDRIIERIDLAGIANQVIEEIDLPEIIRESSGAMASETVLGMRIRSIEADERVNRVIDRVLLRRRDRNAVPTAGGDGGG